MKSVRVVLGELAVSSVPYQVVRGLAIEPEVVVKNDRSEAQRAICFPEVASHEETEGVKGAQRCSWC